MLPGFSSIGLFSGSQSRSYVVVWVANRREVLGVPGRGRGSCAAGLRIGVKVPGTFIRNPAAHHAF